MRASDQMSGCVGWGWSSSGFIHGCFASHGATPRAAVKPSSGWRMRDAGSRHASSGGSGCASASRPALQLQFAAAANGLHLDFREIKFRQRRKNLRQPRPVQIGGQPVGFRNNHSRFQKRFENFSAQRQFILAAINRRPRAGKAEPEQIRRLVFFEFPNAGFVRGNSNARPVLQQRRQIFAPKLRAFVVQPDRQRGFRRAVGASRISKIHSDFSKSSSSGRNCAAPSPAPAAGPRFEPHAGRAVQIKNGRHASARGAIASAAKKTFLLKSEWIF